MGTALNNAIASLPALGGTIYIPSGTWIIDTAVLINKPGITFMAPSNGATLLQFDGSVVPTAFKMADTTQRRVNMVNLRIESTTNGVGTAIDATYCVNSIFDNLRIGNTGTAPNKGIVFGTNTFYNAVREARIQVAGAGSIGLNYGLGANSNRVYGARIFGDSNSTGAYVAAHTVKLGGIDVESVASIGIDVAATGHSCFIDSPYLEGISTGVRVANGVESVLIAGGFIADCPAGGANNIVNNAAGGELKVVQCRVQYNTYNL